MPTVDSNIVLFDSENNIKSVITPETLDTNKDTVIRFKPTDSYYISEARLDTYEKKLKEFMDNPEPSRIVYTPTFNSFLVKQGYLEIELSKFQSDILLLHVSTEYQISNRRDFTNIVVSKLTHDDNEKVNFQIPFTNLDYNVTYYLRVRYGGAGYLSNWSEIQEFVVDKPTIQKPFINPIKPTDIDYTNTVPFTVAINAKSSPYIGLGQHGKSVWTIHRRSNSGTFERAWDSGESTNLTMIRIPGLFPNILKYHTPYYLTVKYLGKNNEYSLESDPVEFSVEELTLSKIENIKIFPPIVNVAQPSISFDSTFKVTIKGQEFPITKQDLTTIHFILVRDDTNVVVYKEDGIMNVLNIPKNILLPNTSYTLHMYYVHKNLGNSDSTEFKFTTCKKFITTEDGLDSPKSIVNNVAYYGEVETNNLMLEGITYTGKYNVKKPYKQLEEVSKDNKLYICIKDTPVDAYSFSSYFKEVTPDNTKLYYKSGLPKPTWLINHIGLNPNLTGPRTEDVDFNIINKQSGWLKFQNKHSQIIYLSKLPIYKEVSVNDLIKNDLFHPRRKTVRIGNKLYYVRTLISSLERGYDSLNQDNEVRKLYPEHYTMDRIIDYEEEKLIEYILNGDMSFIDPVDLDMDTNDYKELCYKHDKLESYRPDLGVNKYNFLGKDIQSPDLRTLVFRPVLELIPEEEYPMDHISSNLPGNNKIMEKYTDRFLDLSYLGTVTPDDFVRSESISIRTGFPLDKARDNISWFKFYYRGLIYYISYGFNYRDVTFKELEEYNFVYSTPLYKTYNKPDEIKLGKVPYNNILFNIGLPQILNTTDLLDHYMVGLDKVDLINNTNKDTKLSYDSEFSNLIYPLLKDLPTNINQPGYKGSYREDTFEQLIESLTGTPDTTLSFFSRNLTRDDKVFYNNQKHLNNFTVIRKDIPGNVLLVLNVHPNLDNPDLWSK